MKDDIKQVNAAATHAGLTKEERIELGERIHQEKEAVGRDLVWAELLVLCEEIKRDFREVDEGNEEGEE